MFLAVSPPHHSPVPAHTPSSLLLQQPLLFFIIRMFLHSSLLLQQLLLLLPPAQVSCIFRPPRRYSSSSYSNRLLSTCSSEHSASNPVTISASNPRPWPASALSAPPPPRHARAPPALARGRSPAPRTPPAHPRVVAPAAPRAPCYSCPWRHPPCASRGSPACHPPPSPSPHHALVLACMSNHIITSFSSSTMSHGCRTSPTAARDLHIAAVSARTTIG